MARSEAWLPVVVGGDTVCDSPPGHGAIGVKLSALCETGNCLFVVVVQHVSVSLDEGFPRLIVSAGYRGGELVVAFISIIIFRWCK